ncbi:MAG: 30S ribosomal protein S5 alanine N-acetyltransferase [Ponticaulis sp.]|nr:30S ribosomal protein S5 alanine N-acetyltransferase [Ponticaulis sp.]|tara:strand:- start:18257 stop:18853 length:597 start_codon:yes stop_codon:yes gene_type:complete
MLPAFVRKFLRIGIFELPVPEADFKLRLMNMADWKSWADVRGRNRDYLQPFEPIWSQDALTKDYFLKQVRAAEYEYDHGMGAMMLMIHLDTGKVMGGINLRNLRRGVAQMATVGYWIGEEWGRAGRMTKAVRAMVAFGFDELGLHRVEAACVPENETSAAVLRRAGFQEEGFAKGYLRINGRWRDHRLFAIVNPGMTD